MENENLADDFGATNAAHVDVGADQHQQEQQVVEQERDPPQRIPLSEHLAEREKRQTAERDAADLRRRLDEFERRSREPQKPAEKPDFWADPEAASRAQAREAVSGAIDPIQQAMLFNSRLVAEQVHGKEIAKKAEEAFNEAARTGAIDPMTHARINGSPNPFHAAVEWFKQQQIMKEIGDDLPAYERRRMEMLLKDPEFLAKAVEAHRALQTQPANRAPNGQFTKPTTITRGPTSLTRAMGGASTVAGDDIDDDDLAADFGSRG